MSLETKTYELFMKEALKQAKKAYEEDEIPIGAVIVCDNKIIARGYNQDEEEIEEEIEIEIDVEITR